MPDYKSMYYHLAGRMATAVDVLEATTDIFHATTITLQANADTIQASTDTIKAASNALTNLAEKLKMAQQSTEDMFINDDDDSE